MKKLAILAAGAALLLSVAPVFAIKPNGPSAANGLAHPGKPSQLYLYEKDANWNPVPGGAWGKMKYNKAGSTFDFAFNGHGLDSGDDYTLIYYPDPWPGNGLICLGNGTANEGGDVHIMDSQNTGDLPAAGDINPGAKIWLVLSNDVDCVNKKMVGWDQAAYLFEYDLISFDDTDV